ncbi:hypothetical protein CAEBREN_20523 [Caenorhabditis brenneri]|uniref:Major facilitator superfamily (MFS) profile domain-containing protein n=1 Tax=Caenorhabditis brenneri TaxID=135651 RepID=G0N2R1_CAEBE|nr:hypothetical protein CAEBREN_20523 [Caenorhabditis brenneri]
MTGSKTTTATTGNGKLVPIAPDGGWGWVVVIGSFFLHVFVDGFVYAFGVIIEKIILEFNSTNTMASLVLCLLTGLTLSTGPVASAFCNKHGCRATAITGTVIAFFGSLMSYYATKMWHLVISVGVFMGIGFGMIYCPAIVIVTMYFEAKRSLATGIAVAGAGVGTMLFSPINAHLMEQYGWRMVFLVFLFILFVCALCGATFAPLEFALVSSDDEKEEEEVLVAAPRPRSSSFGSMESQPPRSRRGTIGERDSGYLNRKDVFYTGSISNVAEFREDPDKYRSTGSLCMKETRRNTVTLAGGDHSTPEDKTALLVTTEKAAEIDNDQGRNMFRTISNMLSLHLLTEPTFLLFAISNCLTSVGFNSPLYFLPLHATKNGLTSDQGAKLLSTFGITNTLGRICFGLIGDRKIPLPGGIGNDVARNRLWMYNVSLMICGLVTTFSFKFVGFTPLSIYASLFGFTIASYICLTSVILVDFLGLDKLTNAFGLLLLWQGVGTVFGPPVAGILADWSENFTLSFVFCGINLMLSGLILFGIPIIQYQAKKKAEAKAAEDVPTKY